VTYTVHGAVHTTVHTDGIHVGCHYMREIEGIPRQKMGGMWAVGRLYAGFGPAVEEQQQEEMGNVRGDSDTLATLDVSMMDARDGGRSDTSNAS
jgi:hypothetical protein